LERPKTPYQEITTEENKDIHGDLTTRSWRGVQVLRARAAFFADIPEAADYAGHLDAFVDGLIRTSGSIDGKHRESTTQAVQGQKAPGIALVGAPAPVNGAANHAALKGATI
jgi:hypothetical protein